MSHLKKNIKMAAVVILYTGCFFAFFYLYIMQAQGKYLSDLPAHIYPAIEGDGYSLMSFLYWLIYKCTGSIKIICIFLSMATLMVAVVTGLIIRKTLKDNGKSVSWATVLFLGLALLFVCKIVIPVISPWYYSTSFVTQPWHNQTYNLMRAFALLTTFMYFKIEKDYLQVFRWKDAFCFTIFLTLANAIKPNFILFFAPVMLMYLIKDFLLTRGKGIRNIVLFGSCVLFSLLVVLWQSSILFPQGSAEASGTAENSGIALRYDVFIATISNPKYMAEIIVSVAFPIIVTAWLLWKKHDKRQMIQLWCFFFVASAESVFLVETGRRAGDGNFIWGRFCAGWLLFVYSIIEYLDLFKGMNHADKKEKFVCCLGGLFCMASVVSGVIYFILLCQGASYGI